MRTLALLFFWLLTTVSVFIATFSWLVISQLSNRTGLYQQLARSGIYGEISTQVSDQLTQTFAREAETEVDPAVGRLITNIINDDLLTPATIQQFVENNIDNFFEYLDGDSVDFVIFLPVSQLNTYLATFPDMLASSLTEELLRLPTCNARQTQNFSTKDLSLENLPSCLPANLKNNPRALKNAIAPASKEFGSIDFPRLTDETPITQLLEEAQSFSDEGTTSKKPADPMPTLRQYRSQWQWVKRAPWIAGGVALLSIILSFAINLPKWRNGLVWISTALLVSGVILLTLVVASGLLTSVFVGLLPGEASIIESLKLLIRQILNQLVLNGLLIALGTIGVALFALLPAWLWPRAKETPKPLNT